MTYHTYKDSTIAAYELRHAYVNTLMRSIFPVRDDHMN